MTPKKSLTVSVAVASLIAAAGLAQAASPPAEIVIAGERIFPESMTSTPEGAVIFGSIGQHAVYRAAPGSAKADVWIAPNTEGLSSTFGVFADPKSNTLWTCSGTSPFGPPRPPGSAPPPPSNLYAFDLKSGAHKAHYPLPTPGSFCNDIAVDAAGNTYATDTNNMEVVRLKKGGAQLEVWAGNGAFGPKGGLLDGISILGKRVLVNTLVTSKLFSVPIESDGKAGVIAEVTLSRPIARPDGMRSFGKDKLLIIEGGDGGRLSKITLQGNNGTVETIKDGYPDGPVAVTVVGTTAYVVEGQFAAMRGGPDAKTKAFHATAVEVGKP
jgi:sugar lactone lactonase YvrE